MRIAAALAATMMASVVASAQTFDVASIKRQVEVVSGMTFAARGSTLTVVNNELTNVIDNAYGIRRYQLIGGPDWIESDRYNIQAKAAGDATRDELMVMTRSLLAERFKLKIHRETREMPIYVLIVAKGGIKAPRSVDGACAVFDPRNPPRPGAPRRPFCGNNLIRAASWNATAIDMKSAAAALVGVLGRNVVDRTGVNGTFDIHVEWTPDQAPAGVDSASTANATAAPPLFTVLEDQLGLKLESSRGPVDVIVIDHVERPTDD
jgi:uncharacterized protein (TIGR03435 family)